MPTSLAAVLAVLAAWWALGHEVQLPPAPLAAGERVHCVSYAPFEGSQSPFDPGLVIAREQIARQLAALKPVSDCVRTYSVGQGLDVVPAVAEELGMTVLLGIWIGRDRAANRLEIDRAIELAAAHPAAVAAVVVGNEVLLRGEQPEERLAEMIAEVGAAVAQPVTYADVWERWVEVPELARRVDFATVHILPYWEDEPVAVEDAVAHVGAVRRAVGERLAGVPILIGETGWPAAGRQREGAVPSPVNQALYVHGLLALFAEEGWDYNLIEAFDQPWKRALEGTVGGHWGFLDGAAEVKFAWGGRLSDHPLWAWQAAAGALLALAVLLCGRRAPPSRRPGLLLLALATGLAVPWWAEQLPLISLRAGDWATGGAALALSLLLPPLAARAAAGSAGLPALAAVLRRGAGPRGLSLWLGWGLVATILLAGPWVLALLFDPRYRDFPTAALAAPVAALALLAPLAGWRTAERALAAALAAAAVAIALNEGPQNGQALLFSLLVALLAWVLARPPRRPAGGPATAP